MRVRRMILHFNPTNYQRIENPRRIDTSASGASFATSTGDIVEASAYGPGVFRIRIGPNARPDYGIVVAKAKPCEVTQRSDDVTTLTSGEAMLELSGGPLRFRLSWEGQVVVESITDQHVRGFTRLPAFGRIREGGEWTAGIALTSGEPVYGLGEKFGPLDKRGQLVHSQVDGALGVNIGLSYKNTPFAWSPGGRRGAWGVFAHTPGRVAHGVGHPDWSHRTYALVVDDEALDLFLFAAKTPADILALYTDLTGRAPAVPRWSLGLWVSRAYYKTPEEAIEVAKQLRERRIPCDVITLDGRAAWDTRTRFDFRWDPARLADAKASLAALHAQNLRVCVWEYPLVSIHGRLFAELFARDFLLTTTQGDPYVMSWDTSSATSPSGNVATLPPESGIVDFTNPQAYAWWRDAHRTLFEEGVDVITSDFGEQVPDDAGASNG
ncbi:MAG TPA: TIM-barrel domain-containing protein, partial [Casimicrobiaceae bacterium]|nr:TIM-barrel domain-containing protein [Casimicrobiaceae bacterium]